LNGDGRLDVVVASSSGQYLGVQLGNGDGTLGGSTQWFAAIGNQSAFQQQFLPVPNSVAVADVDGDGKPDLVSSCIQGVTTVLRGFGGGDFFSPVGFGAAGRNFSAAIADVNGDGRPDILSASARYPGVAVLLNRGTGSLSLAAREAIRPAETASSSGSAVSLSPNPLNPEATLSFHTAEAGTVSVRLFDLQGRLVATPLRSTVMGAGEHSVRISGQTLPSGVYYYRIERGGSATNGRLTILK
jgi:hypothetical protein